MLEDLGARRGGGSTIVATWQRRKFSTLAVDRGELIFEAGLVASSSLVGRDNSQWRATAIDYFIFACLAYRSCNLLGRLGRNNAHFDAMVLAQLIIHFV